MLIFKSGQFLNAYFFYSLTISHICIMYFDHIQPPTALSNPPLLTLDTFPTKPAPVSIYLLVGFVLPGICTL